MAYYYKKKLGGLGSHEDVCIDSCEIMCDVVTPGHASIISSSAKTHGKVSAATANISDSLVSSITAEGEVVVSLSVFGLLSTRGDCHIEQCKLGNSIVSARGKLSINRSDGFSDITTQSQGMKLTMVGKAASVVGLECVEAVDCEIDHMRVMQGFVVEETTIKNMTVYGRSGQLTNSTVEKLVIDLRNVPPKKASGALAVPWFDFTGANVLSLILIPFSPDDSINVRVDDTSEIGPVVGNVLFTEKETEAPKSKSGKRRRRSKK